MIEVEVFDDPDANVPLNEKAVIEGDVMPHHELPDDFPAGAELQDDGSVILRLAYPATLKFRDSAGHVTAETYRELHMQRFNGKRLREVQSASDGMKAAQMIASSTGLSLARATLVHDAMDATDISAVLRVGLFFIAPGRKTGR
jgi:hypothetical protein